MLGKIKCARQKVEGVIVIEKLDKIFTKVLIAIAIVLLIAIGVKRYLIATIEISEISEQQVILKIGHNDYIYELGKID